MYPSYYCSQVMTDALLLERRQTVQREIERNRRAQPALHTALGLGRVSAVVAVILLTGTGHTFGRGYTDPPPRHSGHPAAVTDLGAHTPEMRRAVQRALLTGTPGLRVPPIPVHPEPVAP